MPGLDRTGPWGYGPRTGRGFGICGGGRAGRWGAAGLRPRWGGRGGGFRRWGAGFGWRPGFGPWAGAWNVGANPEDELAWLRRHAEGLEASLEAIRHEIAELEKRPVPKEEA